MSAAPSDSTPGRPWALALGLIVWALAYALVVQRAVPAPVRYAGSTPATDFSAERAQQTLERLLPDGEPHPLGTPAAAQLRVRLLLELRGLGLHAEERSTFVSAPYAVCATPTNVLARLDPPTGMPASGESILLACHYDSVACGPGVADDLMGVATLLECARALKEAGPVARPVIFLFTDGEEQGLLGAQAFVDSHPWRDEVGVVLNIEARGTSGPSLLFETGPDNAWLIELFAGACGHAVTTSLYYEAYRRLPNDTDFSVFKEAGYTGLNFANIENVGFYHTPRDSRSHLDPASMQDHGEHLLGMARALMGADLQGPPAGDAVYTHVFASGMMIWSVNLGRGLALFVLLWLGLSTRRALRSGVEGRHIVRGALLWPAIVLATALAEFVTAWILSVLGVTSLMTGTILMRCLLWTVGLSVGFAVAARFRARAGDAALALGTWIAWAFLALVCALLIPGVSYLFLLPAGVLAVGALFFPVTGAARPHALPLLIGFAVAALLWCDLLHGLEQGFGVLASSAHAVPVAALLSLLAPHVPLAFRVPPRVTLIPFLTLLCVIPLQARHDYDHPARLNIIAVHDAEAEFAVIHVPATKLGLPRSLSTITTTPAFREPEQAFPWSPESRSYQAQFVGDRPALPSFEVLDSALEGGGRRVLGRLTSPAAAWRTQLRLSDEEEREMRVEVRGQALFTGFGDDREEDLSSATFHAVPAEGLEVTLFLPDEAPLEVFVIDTHLDPPHIARSRPDHLVPVGPGDRTLVFTRLTL